MAHACYPNNGRQEQEDQEDNTGFGHVKPYLNIRPEPTSHTRSRKFNSQRKPTQWGLVAPACNPSTQKLLEERLGSQGQLYSKS